MKLLIIMEGFFPGKKYGGPPVSIDNFCSLMDQHESFIVAHDHDLFETERYYGIQEGWNERENCHIKYLSDDQYNKNSFDQIMKEIKPDILYLQGLFQSCVFPCLMLAKKNKIPVLIAPRGELCAGALAIKKWKKIPYIKLVRQLGLIRGIHWQSTSHEETEAIKLLMKANDNCIHQLENIPSLPKKIYGRRDKTVGEGKFIFLSRIHPKKNLLFAISLFRNVIGSIDFDIYGPVEDEEYWKQCQDEMNRLPQNVRVQYKGLVGHDQVHEVFSGYDAFLFPTLSENYGHVIAESLSVGTAVIISNQTPWSDVTDYKAGWAIPLDKPNIFVECINNIVNNGEEEQTVLVQNAYSCFYIKSKTDLLKKEYGSAIESILNDNSCA